MPPRWSSLLVFLAVLGGFTADARGRTTAVLAEADRLFADQHWAEARAAYDLARERISDWHSPDMRRAVEGAVVCAEKLAQWDDAVRRLETSIAHTTDTLDEVAGQRLLAGLYLTVPHRGTMRGGRFVRSADGADVEVRDLRESVRCLERARTVAMRLAVDPGNSPAKQAWIDTDFDLTTALTRQSPPRAGNHPIERWLGIYQAKPDPDASGDGNNDDASWQSTGDFGESRREPPAGIPRWPDGRLRFAARPAAYDPALVPAEKFLFLSDEIARADTSPHRDDAARALFRRAVLAQNLYGPDVSQNWVGWWENDRSIHQGNVYGAGPAPTAPVPATKLWQLGDDQALVPVGGWLRLVDLPADESPLALLAAVETRYPQSAVLPEVRYARALYHQGRQQYPRALAEYRDIVRDFPTHARATDARAQIKEIEDPGVGLGNTQTYFPGERPRLEFTVRNAEKVSFTARRFDLIAFKEAMLAANVESDDFSSQVIFQSKGWRKYLDEATVNWSEQVPPNQENRLVNAATLAPLAEPGVYVVEARLAAGRETSRVLVVVTDILLLNKDVRDGGGFANLLVACDARTGRPLPNRAVRVYEGWREPDNHGRKGARHLDRQTCITDDNGAVFYRRKHHDHASHLEAAMVGDHGRMAFSGLRGAHDHGPDDDAVEEARTGFLVTDRPVYRPGATVHFCLWLRTKRGGVYQLPSGGTVHVNVWDTHSRAIQKITASVDEAGVVSGECTLGPNASLGRYTVGVSEGDPDDRQQAKSWYIAQDQFTVEEYRPPEFEVNVRPSTPQVRLGEKFKASVEARYYFGAPVTQAKVSYKVYREAFERSYFEPAEYDSLYGKGYGLTLYPYPWLSWWERWGKQIGWGLGRQNPLPAPRWNEELYDPRELVAQGETALDAAGKCEVEVDTARAKTEHGGFDHQYTIEATVVGASRRAVAGEGVVVATRQGFYVFVEADRGWYTVGQEAKLRVRALTPGNVPVAVQGQVIVSRVRYVGAGREVVTEEEISRQNAETDAEGRLTCKVPLPEEGQCHVAFRARDAWGEEVQGNAVFWVQGPRFDGRVYRSNELEIISDQRNYHVGDTAHLLLNTAGDDSRVLFASGATSGVSRNIRFVDVPRRSVVVDVPIEESGVPNVFVEATLVRNGQVHVEVCNLVVPPERKLLNVSIRTDKDTYGPGEKGAVHVEATDKSGRPASGEVALTVFDKAVTAIEPESSAMPDLVFYEQNNLQPMEAGSSFDEEFSATEGPQAPQEYPKTVRSPEGWYGTWGFGLKLKEPPVRSRHPSGETTTAADRVVITGSNIPTSEEVGPPTLLNEPPAAGRKGIISVAGVYTDLQFGVAKHPAARLLEPEIRTHFADTALWLPALKLDAAGKADAVFDFPQSLSIWRVHGYVVNAATQVGDGTAQTVTTKKLLVRLLSPRFFTERDEVVLSAAANNYLPEPQDVAAELIVPAVLLQPVAGSFDAPDADGNLHLTARASIAPNSEHRFDWRVKAVQPGQATITVRALTGQESDGMRLAFPVQIHGVEKTVVQGGSFRVGQEGDRALRVEVPAEVDAARTRLEITLSPSLAGVMVDALPFLADYPYGCVEQTMSRFYPSVLVRGTLKKMGTDLETLGNQRRQMSPADLSNRFGDSPVYDSERLERMIREGLAAIYDAQSYGGGWGWWTGDEPSLSQSAYVLQGLQAAKAAGVSIDESVYNSGSAYVWGKICDELAKPAKKQELGNVQQQAYCAYVLSLEPLPDLEGHHSIPLPPSGDAVWNRWLDRLFVQRGDLNNYGRALLALTLQHAKRETQARTVLRNLLQFVERDDSNETAWVRTPQEGWWFWWNNDIESNAWALKALASLDPKNDLAPRLVKWLVNNRRGGSYWRSTRDTAQAISAMTDYLLASGEGAPNCELSVSVDGNIVRTLHVTRENLFTFDNKIVAGGVAFKPGSHEVTIRKHGAGALYYTARLTYFTREEGVKSAGGEIGVERQYFRLVPATESSQPQPEQHAGFLPTLLHDGDELASGDLIEVVLKINAKNTYDYLAFEDPKPAGCEPVEVRSGQRWAGGFCANVEVRDNRTVFFVELLEQGEHLLRYRLRAETPGRFHALPATGMATYAPEVRANSDEMHLGIRE